MMDYILLLDVIPIIGVILTFVWVAWRTGVLGEGERAAMLPLIRNDQGDRPQPGRGSRAIWVRLALLLILLIGVFGPIGTAIVAQHLPAGATPLPAMDEDSGH
ncbi:MAG: hypothetical protein M3Y56_01705 [Armatimonadota bacterium]|nr:hypothetical protein [Armatimonadota bacterium]